MMEKQRLGSIEPHLDTFPYHSEYYTHLLMKENERFKLFQYKARSPELKYRKSLLKDLRLLSDKLNLGALTFHLAVHLLDVFMDFHEIEQHQLMLAASSCLLVAAKYVDVDSNVPRISYLRSLTNQRNSQLEYRKMECMLLNFWKWDLNFATVLHFLDHLLSNDLLVHCAEGLAPRDWDEFKCHVLRLADLTLSEVHFIYFKPSIVAAACLAVARYQFHLLPTWSLGMEAVTGYTYIDIEDCVQHVIHLAQINQYDTFVDPAVCYIQTSKKCDDAVRIDCRWKFKAPVNTYNCARIKRRHLLNRSDLKQMYCAM